MGRSWTRSAGGTRVVAILGCIAALAAGALGIGPAAAGEDRSLVPDDEAVVELLSLPAGATVQIDGADRQRQQRFTFQPLERGRFYTSSLRIRFADGKQREESLLLWGGQRIRLPVADPSQRSPELMLPFHRIPSQFDVSDDGRYVLGSDGAQLVLWEVATGRPLRTYEGFRNGASDCPTFRPGGSHVAAAAFNTVLLFDLSTGKRLRMFKHDGIGFLYAMAFSPDGRWLLTGGYKGDASLWDVESGERLRVVVGHDKTLRAIAFSPDGRKFATGSDDRNAIVWDVRTGQRMRTFQGHSHGVRLVLFSPDGKNLYVVTSNNDTTKALGEIIAWSPGGERLAHCQIDIHPMYPVQCAWGSQGRELFVSGYAFSPEGGENRLLVLRADNLQTIRQEVVKPNRDKASPALDDVVLCDAKLAVAGLTAKLRNSGGRLTFPLEFAAQGGKILMNHALCDGEPGRLLRQFERSSSKDDYQYRILYLSGDGSRLIAVARRKNSNLYDLLALDAATGNELNRIPVGNRWHVSISDDGRRVLNFDHKGASLWDMESGREIQSWPEATGFTLNRDGTRVAASLFFESKYRVVLWDAQNKRQLWKSDPLQGLGFGSRLAFSPDGQHLAASHVGESVQKSETFERKDSYPACSLLDATTGRILHTWRHGELVQSWDRRKVNGIWKSDDPLGSDDHTTIEGLGFSPNGRLAWSWQSASNLILLIDVSSGAVLRKITSHKSWFFGHQPGFAADGRHLAVCCGDGTATLVDIATGREVLRFVRTEQGEWLAATPEGFFDGSEKARQQIGYRIGEGLNVVPVDRFFQDFFRPNLFHEVLAGRSPTPEVKIGQTRPPVISILSPPSGIVESPSVTIEVQAEDQGGGVSGVTLFHNAARVLAAGQTRQEGKRVFRSFQTPLVQGENRLKVIAASGDGSWESEPAEIVLRYEKPLAKSRLYLLAVGINRYADGNLNLAYAATDAQALASLFNRRAKQLYETVQTETILDQDATRPRIKASLKTMAGKTQSQDTLVLFLAGHGTIVGQRYYFVPHELRKQAVSLEDDIRSQGLPADELSEILGTAKALKRLLILDTCASGGALGTLTKGRSGFALRGAIERLSRSQGIFSIAASSASEQAQEAKELGHGVLSYSLLAGLKAVDRGPLAEKHIQPGSPERVVDVLEWFTFAAGQVPRLTEKYSGVAQDVQTCTQGTSFPLLPLEE